MPEMKTSSLKEAVNIGLIGCGGRLNGVVEALLKNDVEHRLRVLAAYDPDPVAQQTAQKIFGMDCQIRSSEEALVNDPNLDWVMIGSWNCHHARQAVLALNAGKNVFCEKPLAMTLEDCIAIREAVRQSDRMFAFGLVLRYSPHYRKLAELVHSGAIGEVISFEFNETLDFNHGGYIFGNWRRERRNAGTHLLEKCCHDIDLANWLVGSLPVRAASFGGRDFFKPSQAGHRERIGPNEKGVAPYATWPAPNNVDPFGGGADIFDNQVAILEYANGVRGMFHTNCNAGIPERRFYICGTEGALRADVLTGGIELQKIGWNSRIEFIDVGVKGGHGCGDEVMAAALVETLLRGTAPLASVDDGLKSAIAAFGIDEAADTGRVVDLRGMWTRAGLTPANVKRGGELVSAEN